MLTTIPNQMPADLLKSYPELESIINTIIADNKQTTSMFVHELRNPLTLLKGTVQYIEMKHPETREFKYWDQLQDLILDMEQLMADAALLNNYNSIKKEPMNLIMLLQGLVNSFMPQADTKKIDLSLTIEPGCEEYICAYSCDGTKLKQVFINLVKNAFEAVAPGNFIHIHMKYLPEVPDLSARIAIEIMDNGLPISADALERIFLPFITYKKGGTGVGLALVKKVIDLHYGSVNVESTEDLTIFTIMLPVT